MFFKMASLSMVSLSIKSCGSKLIINKINLSEVLKANFSIGVPCYTKSRRIRVKMPVVIPEERYNKRINGTGSFQSIIDKGFSLPAKAYEPPPNVEDIIINVFQNVSNMGISKNIAELSIADPLIKYRVLTKCIKVFDHDIPSYMLHTLKTAQDLVEYYSTPIKGLVSYDQMVHEQEREKLPKNLHVIPNPVRFNPETDTFFGGVSAYPNSVSVVPSLKHKKKYKAHTQKYKWPDV